MKKHIRRALAMAVCLIMVIGTMAPYAFAEDTYSVGDTIELGSTVAPPTNIPENTEWQKVSKRTAYDCGKAEGSVEYYYYYKLTGWITEKIMVYDGPLYNILGKETDRFIEGITYAKTDGRFADYYEILHKRTHSHSVSGCNAVTYYTWKLVEKAGPTEPAAPTEDELKAIFDGKISVECQNTDANHASKTYGLLDGSYTVSAVKDSKCNITISAEKYVAKYNEECAGHNLQGFAKKETELTYNNGSWGVAGTGVIETFNVICSSIPDAPEKPADDQLAGIQGAVTVKCTTDGGHNSMTYTLGEFKEAGYTVGDVTWNNGTGFYTCEVTLSDAAVSAGIAKYNESHANHESAGNHTNKVVLKYENNKWVLVDPAMINVKCNSGEIENKPAVVIKKTFFGLLPDEQSKAAKDIKFHIYKKKAGEDTWSQLKGDIKLSEGKTAEIYGLEEGASYYITESGAETVTGDDGSKYLLYDTHYSVVSEQAVAYSSDNAAQKKSEPFEYKGETVTVDVFNWYAVPASFTIEKVDKDNHNTKLQGAEFTLWEIDRNSEPDNLTKTEVCKEYTDKDGRIIFDNLTPGDYVLKETKAPAGYKDNNTEWHVSIDSGLKPLVLDAADTYAAADNRVSVYKKTGDNKFALINPVGGMYIIENEANGGGYVPVDPAPTTGTLTVTKTVTGFEVLPEGYNVTITVKQGDKVVRTATLSSFTDGKATYSFDGLTAGTYTVSETAADVDGYKLEATADQSVTVTAGGTATAAFVNAYTKVEEPVTPDDPENPDVPDKPEKPEKPSKPETPKDNAVKTGDTTNTGIAWGVFGAALLGFGGFAVRRRKASK